MGVGEVLPPDGGGVSSTFLDTSSEPCLDSVGKGGGVDDDDVDCRGRPALFTSTVLLPADEVPFRLNDAFDDILFRLARIEPRDFGLTGAEYAGGRSVGAGGAECGI